ncbi:three component ABC system middle component [Clostridium beijerinckii]|uniref:three component ABC system middle component n=1 Tax=Clostridium beijerinckii TaxID=1520 RepID=UPI001F476667|nr:three component ABC system middle component [Clostridium beijerinckii]
MIDLYNNEAIGAISIASVLKYAKRITYAKALLILPFFAHKETTAFLKNNSVKVRSLEELIVKKFEYFSNFEDRYYSLIPVSINSILILKELNIIDIDEGIITYIDNANINFNDKLLGKRAKNIINGSERLAKILEEDVDSLYLQLRIEI